MKTFQSPTFIIYKVLLFEFCLIYFCFSHENQNPLTENIPHSDSQPKIQHHHEVHSGSPGLNIDKNHVKKHLEGIMEEKKNEMSEEELNFYYFKLHDFNNDDKMDGLELLQAIIHEQKENKVNGDISSSSVKEMASTIDEILSRFDSNKDGYINYIEYSKLSSKGIDHADHQ